MTQQANEKECKQPFKKHKSVKVEACKAKEVDEHAFDGAAVTKAAPKRLGSSYRKAQAVVSPELDMRRNCEQTQAVQDLVAGASEFDGLG